MNATRVFVGCIVGATLVTGCGTAADGPELVSTERGGSALTDPMIPPQASAVTVNHNGVHETWLFVRDTSNNLYVRCFHPTFGNGGTWDNWQLYSVGDVASKPLATVWKQSSGKDYPVTYMLGTDGVIWALYIDLDTPSGSFWVNGSNAGGFTAWQFPKLFSAVNIGYDSPAITHILAADASNNLWTIENDFGTPFGAHKVFQQNSSNQVVVNGMVPQLSLDGETIVGRNLVGAGPDTVVWKATRNQTAHGYKVDWSSASGAGWGVPVAGRFPSDAGSLTNGAYYLTDGTNHRLRSSNSTGADLCKFLTGSVTGSPAANTHAIFIPYSNHELLQMGRWAGTLPNVCYKWDLNDFFGSSGTIYGSPFVANDSQLPNFSADVDGADVFWRANDANGALFHCRMFGNMPICDANSNPSWVTGSPTVIPMAGP